MIQLTAVPYTFQSSVGNVASAWLSDGAGGLFAFAILSTIGAFLTMGCSKGTLGPESCFNRKPAERRLAYFSSLEEYCDENTFNHLVTSLPLILSYTHHIIPHSLSPIQLTIPPSLKVLHLILPLLAHLLRPRFRFQRGGKPLAETAGVHAECT